MLQDVKWEKDVFAAEIKSLIKKVQELTNEKLQKEEEVALNHPGTLIIHQNVKIKMGWQRELFRQLTT